MILKSNRTAINKIQPTTLQINKLDISIAEIVKNNWRIGDSYATLTQKGPVYTILENEKNILGVQMTL